MTTSDAPWSRESRLGACHPVQGSEGAGGPGTLAPGRTRVIAVIAPSRTRWQFATLVKGIDRRLGRHHDHIVFLVDLEHEEDNPRRRLSHAILLKRVDGVIALNVRDDEAELEVLGRPDIPVVAVGTPVPGRSLVRIDDVATARVATEHLIGLGHTRIAFVGPLPDDNAQTLAPRQRLQGFRETVSDHRIYFPAHFMIDAGWTALSASRAVIELLQSTDRPTAVMTPSDEVAMGVLHTARRLGLRIPRDLSVIGIDGHVFSEVMELTTVRQDLQAQGELAAEMLVQRIRNPTIPAATVTSPTELVLRGTTCSPPPDHTDVGKHAPGDVGSVQRRAVPGVAIQQMKEIPS